MVGHAKPFPTLLQIPFSAFDGLDGFSPLCLFPFLGTFSPRYNNGITFLRFGSSRTSLLRRVRLEHSFCFLLFQQWRARSFFFPSPQICPWTGKPRIVGNALSCYPTYVPPLFPANVSSGFFFPTFFISYRLSFPPAPFIPFPDFPNCPAPDLVRIVLISGPCPPPSS